MSSIKDSLNDKRFVPSRSSESMSPSGSKNASSNRSTRSKAILTRHSRTNSGDGLKSLVTTSSGVTSSTHGEFVAQRTISTVTTRTETVGLSAKNLNLDAFKKPGVISGGHAPKLLQDQVSSRIHKGASIEEVPDDSSLSSSSTFMNTGIDRDSRTAFVPFTPSSASSEQFIPNQSFRPPPPAFTIPQSSSAAVIGVHAEFRPSPPPFAWAKAGKSHTSSFSASQETLANTSDPTVHDASIDAVDELDAYETATGDVRKPAHGLEHVRNEQGFDRVSAAGIRSSTNDITVFGKGAERINKRSRPVVARADAVRNMLDISSMEDWSGNIRGYGDDEDNDGDELDELTDNRASKRTKLESKHDARLPSVMSRATTHSPGPSLSPQPVHQCYRYESEHPYDAQQPQQQQAYQPGAGPQEDPYDTAAYIVAHSDRLEAARQKWRDCSMEEWVSGAKDLMDQFDGLLNLVKDHMKTKLDLFASLHQNIADHTQLLDQREDILKSAKEKLVSGAGSVVVGMGTFGDSKMDGKIAES